MKKYRCKICKKNYKSKASLKIHTRIKHIEYYEKYYIHVCDICKRRFKTKKGLEYHTIRCHYTKICRICKLYFKTESELKNHIVQDHNWYLKDYYKMFYKPNNIVNCQICDRMYYKNDNRNNNFCSGYCMIMDFLTDKKTKKEIPTYLYDPRWSQELVIEND